MRFFGNSSFSRVFVSTWAVFIAQWAWYKINSPFHGKKGCSCCCFYLDRRVTLFILSLFLFYQLKCEHIRTRSQWNPSCTNVHTERCRKEIEPARAKSTHGQTHLLVSPGFFIFYKFRFVRKPRTNSTSEKNCCFLRKAHMCCANLCLKMTRIKLCN